MAGYSIRMILCGTTALAGVALSSVTAQAGGFALREQSAYFQGTSFAGAAAGGPSISSMFWNPATMTQASLGWTSDSTYTGVIGNSVITPTTAFSATGVNLLPLGDSGNLSENALIPASYFVWRPTESWAFGVSMNAPFGLVTNPSSQWAGLFYSRESETFSLNVTPQAAYKVNDWISVGVGLQVQYFRVRLDSAFPGSGLTGPFPLLAPIAPDNLRLNAEGFGFGFTAGITLTPTPWTSIGIGYRSGLNQNVEGQVLRPAFIVPTVFGGALIPFAIPGAGAGAQATIPLPDMISLGIRQKLTESFTLLGTAEWTNWSRLDRVPLSLNPSAPIPGIPTELPFEWEDGWFASVGAEYQFNPGLAVRAGIGFERSPITDDTRATRLPDNDRVWASAGLSYSWNDHLTFDLGYTHIFVKDAPINLSAASGNPTFNPGLGTFIGQAQTDVDIFSIGIRYRWGHPPRPLVTKG